MLSIVISKIFHAHGPTVEVEISLLYYFEDIKKDPPQKHPSGTPFSLHSYIRTFIRTFALSSPPIRGKWFDKPNRLTVLGYRFETSALGHRFETSALGHRFEAVGFGPPVWDFSFGLPVCAARPACFNPAINHTEYIRTK